MEIHAPAQSEFHCPTCSLPFNTTELYKQHYKSDHHRYNIKRKMVKLPPVTAQQFNSKMTEVKSEAVTNFNCNQCRKTFGSANTLNQHVKSKGHNPNAIVETKASVPKAPFVFERNDLKCLFCPETQSSFDLNEAHMQKEHGFFISQKEFCRDIKGLVEYLQEKIEVGNLCITCDNKGTHDFQSADAVQRHMQARCHTFMQTNHGFEEYEKFYDFSILFEEKLKEQKNIIPGIQFEKVTVFVDEDEEIANENDENWEDDDSDSQEQEWESDEEDAEKDQGNEEEETGVERKKPVKEERKKLKTKTYRIMKPTMTANDELLLPNGRILGHRKYRHIYSQSVTYQHKLAQQLKSIANGQAVDTVLQRRCILEAAKATKLAENLFMAKKKQAHTVGMANNNQAHFRCANSL